MTEETKSDTFIHPHDRPCTIDLSIPLTEELFLLPPVDILHTKLNQIIGNKFLAKKGQTEQERETTSQMHEVTADYLESTKFIGLLFSAEACAPCHTMLQLLRNFYTDINVDERQFEIVLVSSDQTEKEWYKAYSSMPWTSLPYGDERIQQFMKKYNVLGVPQLIVLDSKTGFEVTHTARKDLTLAQSEDVGVRGVWKSWNKLLEINKQRGIKHAKDEALANAQRELNYEKERRKVEIARIHQEGGEVKAEIA